MNFNARLRLSRLLAIAWLVSISLFGLSGCGGGSDSGSFANQADIDTSYATQGKATFPLGVQEGGVGPSRLQTDGKLVIAGWRQTASLPVGNYGGHASSQVYVLRLNDDGSTDTRFGDGGEIRFNVKGSDTVADIKLQPDGKILLAVRAIEPCVIDFPSITPPCKTPSGELATLISAIVRLTPQGVLDSTFGVSGIVEAPASSSGLALAAQADGKILLLHSTSIARARIFGWNLARYHADGAPDSTFNQGNAVLSKCATDGVSMAVQADGRIVVGGTPQGVSYAEPKDNPGFCLERINADGSHDSGFRAASLWTKFDANVELKSLALLANGGLLAVGSTCDGAMCRAVASRYDAEGQPDISFGINGIVQPTINEVFRLTDYVVTPVGDLVLLGFHALSVATGSAQRYQPIWIRLDANGQAKNAFGVNGVLYGVSDTLLPQNLVRDDKGRWLVINRSNLSDDNVGIVVMRIIGDSQ